MFRTKLSEVCQLYTLRKKVESTTKGLVLLNSKLESKGTCSEILYRDRRKIMCAQSNLNWDVSVTC